MSRSAYGKSPCYYCGRRISNAGWAKVSHMRKHVREGLVTEEQRIDYSQGTRNFRTYLRFSATEEGKRARKHLVKVSRARRLQQGQGLLEYALLLILVALIVIVLLGIFGRSVGNMFSNIISNI